uniref:EamA domain-containing protein n=1 Tax=Oryza punctata TaxID=4537 RepID=A0A0E0K879_ORYPU
MARGGGYGWALAAGLNAALAAVSAKFFAPPLLKYSMVILFNVTMWGCYVNSLKALSSLQATVTNFAANFISSGLAGYFLFEEPLPSKWFVGASLIIVGVFILSKSSIEKKLNSD